MPSKSKKQARFMAAAAHNPKFAKKVGINQSVAKDFNQADAGTGILRKAKGGRIAAPRQSPLDLAAGPDTSMAGRKSPAAGGIRPRTHTAGGFSGLMHDADRTSRMAADKLSQTMSKFADGGKVGVAKIAMTRLQRLADQFNAALQAQDNESVTRIARQLDAVQPGTSRKLLSDAANAGAEDKLATFAKGGKVSVLKQLKEHPMWDELDYRDLKQNGHSDADIKAFWDRDWKEVTSQEAADKASKDTKWIDD